MKSRFVLISLFLLGLILSAINPHDYFTWILEVFPAIIGFLIVLISYNRFRFTGLVYVLLLVHSYILFVGGHYTYAEVPAFDWIKDFFHQNRNNYDKIGHFAQGFVPAFIIREWWIRKKVINSRGWMNFLIVCFCVFISVMYEFLEWGVALISHQSAEAFLGTQGDVWDTQSDMLCATIGAFTMVLLFSAYHDRQIKKLRLRL